MRFSKALIFGLSLAALTGVSFAGEDSTHRLHCTGQNYWDVGAAALDPVKSDCGAVSPLY